MPARLISANGKIRSYRTGPEKGCWEARIPVTWTGVDWSGADAEISSKAWACTAGGGIELWDRLLVVSIHPSVRSFVRSKNK